MTVKLTAWLADIFAPPPFEPHKHRLPLPREKSQKKVTTSQIPDNVFFDRGFGKHVVKTTDTTTKSTNWEVVKDTNQVQTERQRHGDITENDRQELTNRDLKIDIALIVKPYWVKRIGRKDAAGAIQQKGIYQSLIGQYYAAFSAANGETEH